MPEMPSLHREAYQRAARAVTRLRTISLFATVYLVSLELSF